MEITHFEIGPYSISHSFGLIIIEKQGFYVRIEGSEAATVFDVFTEDCENEEAIDKYFEIAKLPDTDYFD